MDAQEWNGIFQHRSPGHGNPVGVARRIDYAGTNDPVYIGFARAGVAETDPLWYVEFLEYDADGRYIKSTFSAKNVTWSGRGTHAYS